MAIKVSGMQQMDAREVRPGALVWSQGYRWQVNSVSSEADRVVLYCVAADAPGRQPAPAGYRDSMSLGYASGAMALVEAAA